MSSSPTVPFNTSSFAHYLSNPHLLSIEEQWKAHQQKLTSDDGNTRTASSEIVFALQFVKEDLLVGCTSEGRILVWKIPQALNREENDGAYDADPLAIFSLRNPDKRTEAATAMNLYAMELIKTAQAGKELLVLAGDGGVYVLDWVQQIQPHLQQRIKSSSIVPLDPLQFFQPHPDPWDRTSNNTEFNDICFTPDHQHMFAASGDAFGCYKWNLATGQLVTTYQPKQQHQRRGAYLHTVSTSSDGNGHTVLIGGEQSTLELWDGQADQRIESLPTSMSLVTCSTSSMAPQWWMVGGSNNTVATYHGPTRSLVHETTSSADTVVESTATIQQIQVTNTSVVTVGNEPWVSHWKSRPVMNVAQDRVMCHSASAFALASSDSGEYLAVGGKDSVVDVYYETNVPYCQLRVV